MKKRKLTLKIYKLAKKRLAQAELKAWKENVRARDGYKCVICGGRGSNVHHILPWQYIEYRTDLNNGILLCSYHHRLGKLAAHQNALFFSKWLEDNRPETYYYLLRLLKLL